MARYSEKVNYSVFRLPKPRCALLCLTPGSSPLRLHHRVKVSAKRSAPKFSYHCYIPILDYMGANWTTEVQVLNYLRHNRAARHQIIRSLSQAGIIETGIFFLTHPHFDEPLVLPCSSGEHNIEKIVNTRLETIAGIMKVKFLDLVK